MSDSLIIIPTYNEKENIEKIIRKGFSLEKSFHILIVDDGSPDGTASIVNTLQKEYSDKYTKLLYKGSLELKNAYGNEANYVKAMVAEKKAITHEAQQEELADLQKQYESLTNLTKKYYGKSGQITPYVAPKATPKAKRERVGGSSLLTTMDDLTDAKAGIAADNLATFNAEVERLSKNIDAVMIPLKVSSNDLADLIKAKETVKLAFIDGLLAVFIDDQQKENLEEQIHLTDSLADLRLNIELESSIEKTINIKTYNNISEDFKLTKGNI